MFVCVCVCVCFVCVYLSAYVCLRAGGLVHGWVGGLAGECVMILMQRLDISQQSDRCWYFPVTIYASATAFNY